MLPSSPQALPAGLLPHRCWQFVSFLGGLLSLPVTWLREKYGVTAKDWGREEIGENQYPHSPHWHKANTLSPDPERPSSSPQ